MTSYNKKSGKRLDALARKRSGTMGIMEYMMTAFFIIIIIIVIVLFMGFWQATQLTLEKSKNEQGMLDNLLTSVTNSPYLVREPSVFDEGKLIAANEACVELGAIFGDNWFAEVKPIDYLDVSLDQCQSLQEHDGCNYWPICLGINHNQREYISYVMPVNVYRNFGHPENTDLSFMELAVVEVGIYVQ